MKDLRIHIRDLNPAVVEAWNPLATQDKRDFQFSVGDIFLAGRHDAIIAAGNSFGIMDGGLDLVYRNHFGMEIQDRTRAAINSKWGGVLPVGAAEVVATASEVIPLMIYVPTMVRPMVVRETWNAYLAFKAALWAAVMDPRIRTVLCPGLCTLTGRMHPRVAAQQMLRAWQELGLHNRSSYPWS